MKKVLIVDDSRFIQVIVKEEISKVIEADISIADSIQETKKLLKDHNFDVAILDIHLPDAEHGEVIDLVLFYDIPVIVLTGGMNKISKDIILKKDIIEYITKSDPETISYVATVVKRVLKNYDTNALVVDDSKSSRLLVKMHLEQLKINVIEASSAEEAMKITENSDKKISMILTDYEMPGMNGMELTMHLRQKYSKEHLSIIAVSGSNKASIATDFLRHGANDFIKNHLPMKSFQHEQI